MVLDATVAGLVGGLVMSVWKMAEAGLRGRGIWRPPNLIATIILGDSADTGRFSARAFTVGMALHALVSALMGWVYGLVIAGAVQDWPVPGRIAAIVAYALLSWAVYQWLIMPRLAPTMDREVSAPSLAVAHVVWAAGFAWWFLAVADH